MTVGIYKLVDRITGETLWVGQSVNLESRHRRHLRNLRDGIHSQQPFVDWYRESNRTSQDILMEILEICSADSLNELEAFWFRKDPPRFYGQMPSSSRKWYLSPETRAKMSKTHRERIQSAKTNGTYVSTWSYMNESSRKSKSIRNREVGFNSVTASTAGRKGLGKSKTDEHRRKVSETIKELAKEILSCPSCGRECKGKSALGRHMTVHAE